MGRFDADGFPELFDRRKDMIISGGFNVYPADIEVLLLKHADVTDVAVIGIPSDEWGDRRRSCGAIARQRAPATS
jgi:acyl-CoA synthetase (AMP-forming)/AMP-acid ligase II